MIDVDTDVSILYVMIDDFCQSHHCSEARHPGPAAALSCSEVVTLALFGQWAQFASERAFYRYAERHLRTAFPTLPDRSQFNRMPRQHQAVVVAFGLYLVHLRRAPTCLYECWGSSGIPTRDACTTRNWLVGRASR
jgi:hypothetical protein